MAGATDSHRDDQDRRWIEARAALILRRLPSSVRVRALWLLDRWPGRVLARSVRRFMRLEMFDRSMTIAAQFFTSIVPILILLSTWGVSSGLIMDAMEMPETSRAAVESAVQGAGASAFGIVGALVVLVSATSLSRALARAFSAIWSLPRPRSGLGAVWRWLVVLLVLVLFLIGTRVVDGTLDVLPPRDFWTLAAGLLLGTALAIFVPWVLLTGAVHPRQLMPGAFLFSAALLAIRPLSSAWLPHALAVSAERYGSIGVAFTYLTWLYVISLSFLTCAVVGNAMATDRGRLGQLIRATGTTVDSHDM